MFDEAFRVVLGIEREYVNDPKDMGGETKFGISKRSYPTLDIPNLTLEEAKEIYRRDFWEKIRGEELPPEVAIQLFDSAVNHGVRPAIKLLQLAVGTEPDGVLGPKTLGSVWRMDEQKVVRGLLVARLEYYTTLLTWADHGRGWVRRVCANLRRVI
jgi:lysozyme family protein